MTKRIEIPEVVRCNNYDWVLSSSVAWPGTIAYRGKDTKPGRGYCSELEALERLNQVNRAYNAKYGVGTNLRIEYRYW